MRILKRGIFIILIALGVIGVVLNGLALMISEPERTTYGATFATPYARDLGLDWRKVYDEMFTELGVRHVRLAAHWPMVEPHDDAFNFTELDHQLRRAKEADADVILSVGRRLPRWPECHDPQWVEGLSKEQQREERLEYVRAVVERYRDEPHITHWQVENEPYLVVFARKHCGELDEQFFKREIELVRELDTNTPILLTDSGNLGTWWRPYRLGDAFGTSVYKYFWHPEVGTFESVLPPEWYRAKLATMQLLFGKKPAFLIELAAEPWLPNPITEVPLDVQLERMNPERFDEMIQFAKDTHLSQQYLWGVEWWYWLKERHGDPRLWERAKELFSRNVQ